MNDKRIHIIGPAGSGKTTLARKLAALLDAPCHELDHVGYESGAKRPLPLRLEDVWRIASQPAWVSEGGFLWWVTDLLQGADVIVWLDLPWMLCYQRIVMRHVRADLAGNNAYPGFRKMLRFAARARPYRLDTTPAVPADPNDDAANNRAAVAQVLGAYAAKVVHCRRPSEVARFLSKVTEEMQPPLPK